MVFDYTETNYNKYLIAKNIEEKNIQKYENFKERIKCFQKVNTLQEAKELAKKILPTANEINIIRIGNAKCTIINNEKEFNINVETVDEYISYNFN